MYRELDNVLQLTLYCCTMLVEFIRSIETEYDFLCGKLYIRGLYLPEYIYFTYETWLKLNFTDSKQMIQLHSQKGAILKSK